ncbi:disease resistance protein L6-like isoform X2 [Macadamia integrifolia]|uniref:disease resistance protein L6-like isoform X2 n=1 Tax=Macadamia integrifolia TaxID=60698 RepID=UPI001C52B7CF|nr:disease resistance protein L6-like isoform X2 [Macadamia integrifolia]
MAALGSVSSAAVSSSYDVFLNFRGKDTRNNFTAFLNQALKNCGINVFMDTVGLSTGDEIGPTLLRALQSSRISIVVLSENYAGSKWCLMELAQIVQCQRSNGQKVLPIFYHVDPSDIRQPTGRFEEPFEKHEIKFGRDTIDSWREALRVVGNFNGVIVDQNMDQAEVVDRVVKKVLNELVPNSKFEELMQMVKTFKEFVINSSKRITSLHIYAGDDHISSRS